ncbi:hypothetical protein [Streptomyces lateritius]|uniref:hypothetical protein n=1 Tax=Streptomyces lateritius TaxID=67313 RepID=UPI001673DD75|nr:hypothetical protein [Streptomyces lateritius]GGT72290.1 hypothetical protein GCM10010272_14270 [Streptomyces lateritius]
MDPNDIGSDWWAGMNYWPDVRGEVIRRHKVMRYDFGTPLGLGRAVYNNTSDPIKRTIGGEVTAGTSSTWSISSTLEASFFNVVKASVGSGFSQTWNSETKFSGSLEVTISPGHMSWLEVKPVMRTLDSDFVAVMTVMGFPSARRFSGLVTAPGVEGSLQDVVVVKEALIPPATAESSASATATPYPESAVVRHHDDGTVSLPAHLAALVLGDSAKSKEVTDEARPANPAGTT